MTAPTAVDVDTLPPTQYLMLETLAARLRTGEPFWTFPDRLKPTAVKLEALGLVWTRSGPTENAFQVWPTDTGRAAILPDTYTPPNHQAQYDRDRELADAIRAVARRHPNGADRAELMGVATHLDKRWSDNATAPLPDAEDDGSGRCRSRQSDHGVWMRCTGRHGHDGGHEWSIDG